MLGAIIGSIAGSTYKARELILKEKNGRIPSYEERTRILDSRIPLFQKQSYCAENVSLMFAIEDAFLQGKTYEEAIEEWRNKPKPKVNKNFYSESLIEELKKFEITGEYESAAAKMVSTIGKNFRTLLEVEKQARLATLSMNNSPDVIHSAEALAATVFLARNGASKQQISDYLSFRLHYYLLYDLENLQRTNVYIDKAKVVVSEAIYILMISSDFEDGIRKAISIGGDSESIASLAGSVLEAYYGVPESLKKSALFYLNEEQKEIINQFYDVEKNKEKENKRCNPL